MREEQNTNKIQRLYGKRDKHENERQRGKKGKIKNKKREETREK